jgi:hypothetical protein
MKKLSMITAAALCLSACAKHTDELPTSYTSPMLYQDYTCQQLTGEMARLTRRAQELTRSVNDNASSDSVAMGVGLILFWPSLFFIDGDNPDAQEYSRVKGEYEAVEQQAIMKDCAGRPATNPFIEAEKAYKAKQQPVDNTTSPNRRKR